MRNLNSSFDYISKDYKGFKQSMIERLKVLMPEYTDLSETDAGIVILELASVGLDILSAYLDSQANESLLVSAELWSSALKWAKMLSYEPRFATPSTIEQVFKLKSAQTTNTIIEAGTQVMTSNSTNESPVYFETVDNLIIPAGKLGDEVDENGKYIYTIDAMHGISIKGEVIGTSNGAKDQEFKLGYSPVIYTTIEIWCDGIKWTKAKNNSFVNSEGDDTHFTITMNDLNEAVILFGDNVFGKIPPKDKQIFAYYRIGGGVEGNVAPNTVTALVQTDARIEETFNPYSPKANGQDRESLKSIKLSAPALSRTTWGALTLTDFTDLILANFPDVKLAKTLRGDEAANRNITVDTTCDDIVICALTTDMDGNFEYGAHSPEFTDKIQKELNTRKLAGINNITLTTATPVMQQNIVIQASLLSGYSPNESNIAKQLKSAFIHYFDAGNVQIDETLDLHSVETYISENVTGVNFVRINQATDYSGVSVKDTPIISIPEGTAFLIFIADEENTNCNITFIETGNTFNV